MTMTLSEIAWPQIVSGLQVLELAIGKAEAHAKEHGIKPAALLEARLVPDMFCFADQIQAATDTSRRAFERLSGREVSSKDDPQPTFEGLRERCRETLEGVLVVDKAAVDAAADREFEVAYGPDVKLKYTGKTYVLSFLIPNVYFHVTTAYNILRERGVGLGKRDFLGPLVKHYGVG